MGYWHEAKQGRDQIMLIPTTLSDRIAEDHSVRLFWELLESYDWRAWESQYCGCHGQPAIPPRIVAGVLLYGLTQGIRSSRRLEWACGHAVDFMWLAEGRSIDHSTLCNFRRRFGEQLKDLFCHIGRLAYSMGVVRLNTVGIDGTRVAASSSRHGARKAESLEADLAKLDERMEALLAEAEQVDQQESSTLFEDTNPVTSVPKELASLQARQAKLKKALEQLQARQAQGSSQSKVAVADPEAPIVPNKGGGFAPNYTPVLATDSAQRFIVAETVQGDVSEGQCLMPLLEQTEQTCAQLPEKVLADSAFCTPDNLESLEQCETDAYVAPANERLEGNCQTPSSLPNAASRPNPREALEPSKRGDLARTSQGRLAKEAFIYDQESDCYWCPLGQALAFSRTDREHVKGRVVERRVYICRSCGNCPLRAECAGKKRYRRIRSRGRNPLREQMAEKIHSKAGREIYKQRQYVAEAPFGVIKQVMGVRQFLSRGLGRVRCEWRWICTAYNIRILVRWLEDHRRRWLASGA